MASAIQMTAGAAQVWPEAAARVAMAAAVDNAASARLVAAPALWTLVAMEADATAVSRR